VATPEKLDFAIRQRPEVLDDVGLVVLDEGHIQAKPPAVGEPLGDQPVVPLAALRGAVLTEVVVACRW
jgi:hypothetical protein